MTPTSQLATIFTSISGLNISGVTVKDTDEIPEAASMLGPILFPQPAGILDNLVIDFMSLGSNGTAAINLSYTLHYVYLHARAGAGLNQLSVTPGIVTNITAIMGAIMSNDKISGLIDLKLSDINSQGMITDPAGNDYWGALISLRILEYAS